MTPTLKQLAELDEKATQGKWEPHEYERALFRVCLQLDTGYPEPSYAGYTKPNSEFLCALVNAYRSGGRELMEREGWQPIADAPMWVYGNDALIGQFVPSYGWKKVTIWEPGWTRDDCIARGATHWWPHLRDLPDAPSDSGETNAAPQAAKSDLPIAGPAAGGTKFVWGLHVAYPTGYIIRWFQKEKDRNNHERSLLSYSVKPIYLQRINPENVFKEGKP